MSTNGHLNHVRYRGVPAKATNIHLIDLKQIERERPEQTHNSNKPTTTKTNPHRNKQSKIAVAL